MTDNQTTTWQPVEAEVKARLKDMEEENELLLLQLHQVQEELEIYFLKCQELEKGGVSVYVEGATVGGWVDDELPVLQAEASRLSTLVETQTRLRDIESKNALNARLGDILIQSVSPSGSIVGLPGKLMGVWRASKAEQPPAALGGKNFDKVIEVFQAGGLESVNQLLAKELAPEMRAKAFTELARHLMKNGQLVDAALSARRAYEEEPKPFRLKWLAFRLHEAGEIAEADACLNLLPQDTPFSDSEVRQREKVHSEAKSLRLREAKQNTGFESRRQAMESKMRTLRCDCDTFAKLAAEREAEIKSLQQVRSRLEQENSVVAGRLEEAEHRAQALDQARYNDAKLAADRKEENELLLTQLHQVQGELERQFSIIQELEKIRTKLEQEKSALATQSEEASELAAARLREIKTLTRSLHDTELEKAGLSGQLEESARVAAERQVKIDSQHLELDRMRQEKKGLVAKLDESVRLSADRQAEIESLRQALANLEQQLSMMASQQEDSAKHLVACQAEVESLQQVLARREQERKMLTGQHEHVVRQVADRQAEIDSLREVAGKFDQDLSELKKSIEELTRERDEQSSLAQNRIRQIEELQRKALERENAESELSARQVMIREEMVRAEAQLDLLKEILLREPGL